MGQIYIEPSSTPDGARGPWFRQLNRYHWFVLIVAALGWLFDCLDQQIFVLTRKSAIQEVLQDKLDPWAEAMVEEANRKALEDGSPTKPVQLTVPKAKDILVDEYSTYVTSIFMLGWATGGLVFGVMGDRIGRVKTMLITILLYSAFTGLSSIAKGFTDFAIYRFLTGLGIGGEFAVGVALIAESMPDGARAGALTLLQMLSVVGNVCAALITMGMGILEVKSAWRVMYLIGAAPALLAVVIRWKLKEPERWQKVSHEGAAARQLGSYRELLGHPVWRKRAFGGLLLAVAGVVGLWGIGFFSPELTNRALQPKIRDNVFEKQIQAAQDAGKSAEAEQLRELHALVKDHKDVPQPLAELNDRTSGAIKGGLTFWSGVTGITLQTGGFFGMFVFGYVAQRIGRKPTFAITLVAACGITAGVFLQLKDFSQLFWMLPLMGFFQLSLFAGYAVYFPELFPTYLRSTGTSFCYNVGRFIAAGGPYVLGQLTKKTFAGTDEPFRYAAVTMCSVFLLGLIVLPFLPETKGKPLPE